MLQRVVCEVPEPRSIGVTTALKIPRECCGVLVSAILSYSCVHAIAIARYRDAQAFAFCTVWTY